MKRVGPKLPVLLEKEEEWIVVTIQYVKRRGFKQSQRKA